MRIDKYRTRSFQNIEKMSSYAADNTYICKCGCRTIIYPMEKRERKICRHCGYYVYKDAEKQKQYDFKIKMLERLKNG